MGLWWREGVGRGGGGGKATGRRRESAEERLRISRLERHTAAIAAARTMRALIRKKINSRTVPRCPPSFFVPFINLSDMAIPELQAKKAKRAAAWAAAKAADASEARAKARTTRSLIFKKAAQYANEYKQQVRRNFDMEASCVGGGMRGRGREEEERPLWREAGSLSQAPGPSETRRRNGSGP